MSKADGPRHRGVRVVAALLVLGATVPAIGAVHRVPAAAPAAAPRRVVVPLRQLPPGPGRDRVAGSCFMCHSATLITQQHKDSTAWEKTIGQMEKWGAPVAPAVHDSVRSYLVEHFGPRPTH